MKKFLVILLPVLMLALLTAFNPIGPNHENGTPQEEDFSIPEDVSAIFDKSCIGCHNVDSQNEKARDKLLIDQLGSLSRAKLVGKLGKIGEVAEKNEMPPEKFLEKYPDRALSDEDAKRLKEWTDAAAEELLK